MGTFTLTQFRNRLQHILGNRGFSNADLDDWLNMGLSAIVGYQEFDQQKLCAFLDTVPGAYKYVMPERYLGMISIVDITNKRRLRFTDLRNFALLEQDTTENEARGKPTKWSRRKDTIMIWPNPDGVYRIELYYYEDFPAMNDANGVSPLPRTYDYSILAYAASYAFSELDEDARSDWWLQRAIHHTRSRMTEEEYQMGTPSEGVRVLTSLDELDDFDEVDL